MLGQAKVAAKPNAIVAIPRLPDLLEITGAIVTIDAMGRHMDCRGDIAWLQDRHLWPGLESIVMVETVREIGIHPGAKIERQTRCYIASAAAEAPGQAIRNHWGIENGLHWVMDMVFRDDECRIRKDNAPANFATVKPMASNLLRRAPGRDGLCVKRRAAAWDDDFLASLVTS